MPFLRCPGLSLIHISRVDKQLLEQYHEGLICLSACLAGEIPQAILSGDYERAKASALWYRDLFGEGNYYIELQDHGLEEDNIVLPQLIKLARETGIPMAATNDSHYLRKEDAKMQAILLLSLIHIFPSAGQWRIRTPHCHLPQSG